MTNQMNEIATFLRIVQSLKEDGALEREDWLLLLPLMITLVKNLKDAMGHKPVLYIALSGVHHILKETLETIEEERANQ